ncbi:DUF5131 family protein [uncultured Methylobacterium sp.]|uniref:DUF5131 family protein n=1 Tax=uncultured Methylobacterium sp. TaxID=157278 RepID=UPI0035CA1984
MSGPSPIEWTDATWNTIGGCSIRSAGCGPCYAQQLAGTRLYTHPLYAGTTTRLKGKPVFNGRLTALPFDHPTWTWPLRWRGARAPILGPGRPSLIFVGDMSDLFHEARSLGYAMRVWMTAYRVAGRHILQLLTKRPEVMLDFVRRWQDVEAEDGDIIMANGPLDVRAAHSSGRSGLFADYLDTMGAPPAGAAYPAYDWMEGPRWWPDRPTNVWLGFSAERQPEFNARWPAMRTLAALGFTIFLSYEPAIGPLNLPDDFLALGRRAQVIAGGMSGRDAEPAHPDWFRVLRDQCRGASLPFFFKQWGEWGTDAPFSVDVSARRVYRGEIQTLLMPGSRTIKLAIPTRDDDALGPPLTLVRYGKRIAGRSLDGVEHDEMPEVRA